MFIKFTIKLLILVLLVSNVFGGLRLPGKYSGVVIFDRWDTCYLHSGTYLMYVTQKRKELLRRYAGQSIVVDAKKVFQPDNPGDGLITELEYVGKAKTNKRLPKVDGLKFTAALKIETDNRIEFELEIENQSRKTIGIVAAEIAPTLFGEKRKDDESSPSDGRSLALITRRNFEYAKNWKRETGADTKNSGGQTSTEAKDFSIEIKNPETLPATFELAAGQKRQIIILLDIPHGDYDFLFGYGGGVHEGKSLTSNLVSFAVDEKGKASLISSATNREKPIGAFNFDQTNLFFNYFHAETRLDMF